MENFRSTQDTISKLIEETEGKRPEYCYEIHLASPVGAASQPLTSRKKTAASFNEDFDRAIDKASESNLQIHVKVFTGLSATSTLISDWVIPVNGQPAIINQMQQAPQNQPQSNNQMEELLQKMNMLINPQTGMGGGFGQLGQLGELGQLQRSYDKQEVEHRFEKIKFESDLSLSNKELANALLELKEAKQEVEGLRKELDQALDEKEELEEIVSNNAPQQLAGKVAIGAVTAIGTRLLSSPKIAGLLGIGQDELAMALGVVDNTASNDVELPVVDFESEEPSSDPKEEARKQGIQQIVDTLKTNNLDVFARFYTVFLYLFKSGENMDRVFKYVNQFSTENQE